MGEITMATTRIEQIIDDIIDYLDNCKSATFAKNSLVVPRDDIFDLLDELKLRTPDEIKRYQKIIANREMILKDAEMKAAAIIADAQEKANRMISEHEIMQQAYTQANDLVKQANDEADRVRKQCKSETDDMMGGAFAYTNDLLTMVENILNDSYNNTKVQYDNMLSTLRASLDVVKDNKNELNNTETVDDENKVNDISELQLDDNTEVEYDDFQFDPDKFINDID